MSVYQCPHCKSIVILVGDDAIPLLENCPKHLCGGILDRLDEPEAGAAVRAALYGHDHGFTEAPAVP